MTEGDEKTATLSQSQVGEKEPDAGDENNNLAKEKETNESPLENPEKPEKQEQVAVEAQANSTEGDENEKEKGVEQEATAGMEDKAQEGVAERVVEEAGGEINEENNGVVSEEVKDDTVCDAGESTQEVNDEESEKGGQTEAAVVNEEKGDTEPEGKPEVVEGESEGNAETTENNSRESEEKLDDHTDATITAVGGDETNESAQEDPVEAEKEHDESKEESETQKSVSEVNTSVPLDAEEKTPETLKEDIDVPQQEETNPEENIKEEVNNAAKENEVVDNSASQEAKDDANALEMPADAVVGEPANAEDVPVNAIDVEGNNMANNDEQPSTESGGGEEKEVLLDESREEVKETESDQLTLKEEVPSAVDPDADQMAITEDTTNENVSIQKECGDNKTSESVEVATDDPEKEKTHETVILSSRNDQIPELEEKILDLSVREKKSVERCSQLELELDKLKQELADKSSSQLSQDTTVATGILARKVKEGKESETILRQRLEEKERDIETADRKVKDLQLRLKRFTKDDQAKDERIRQMEREFNDLSEKMKSLEEMVDTNANKVGYSRGPEKGKTEQKANGTVTQKNSKTCIIL